MRFDGLAITATFKQQTYCLSINVFVVVLREPFIPEPLFLRLF
jgi:hypothetical protein